MPCNLSERHSPFGQTTEVIAKVKESATFLVSKDPVKTELGSFYRIILSCPILPKNKPKL